MSEHLQQRLDKLLSAEQSLFAAVADTVNIEIAKDVNPGALYAAFTAESFAIFERFYKDALQLVYAATNELQANRRFGGCSCTEDDRCHLHICVRTK
ncbi:MAG: hypothetical protein FWD68_15790 [Alphaproteobacteria bacterium]|nr:hypothetical protein [Alphaproteobacteria bacterium]